MNQFIVSVVAVIMSRKFAFSSSIEKKQPTQLSQMIFLLKVSQDHRLLVQ
jgi:hypothetical protein